MCDDIHREDDRISVAAAPLATCAEATALEELRAAYLRASGSASWPSTTLADPERTAVRAELELLRVHHAELARVLARAALMREHHARTRRVQAFQQRAVETLGAARAAGAGVPSVAEHVAHAELRAWPSSLQLACSAWDLEPSLENERLIARYQRAGRDA